MWLSHDPTSSFDRSSTTSRAANPITIPHQPHQNGPVPTMERGGRTRAAFSTYAITLRFSYQRASLDESFLRQCQFGEAFRLTAASLSRSALSPSRGPAPGESFRRRQFQQVRSNCRVGRADPPYAQRFETTPTGSARSLASECPIATRVRRVPSSSHPTPRGFRSRSPSRDTSDR